jgi:hypothetical protein
MRRFNGLESTDESRNTNDLYTLLQSSREASEVMPFCNIGNLHFAMLKPASTQSVSTAQIRLHRDDALTNKRASTEMFFQY